MPAIKSAKTAPQLTVSERLCAGFWFVVATLFMLEMRETLDAATGGDKSDGKYRQGL